MTSVILAGGLGTRLRPVVSDRPKALAAISNRPFLEVLLERLSEWGVRKAILCVGYMGEQVEKHFGSCHGSVRLVYSHESTPLGTAGALRLAFPQFGTDRILVLNGDSLYRGDPRVAWQWHVQKKARTTLILSRVSDRSRYGTVSIAQNGGVNRFVEKDSSCQGPGWVSAGIYVMQTEVVQGIALGRPVSLEKEVFPPMIGQGLYGFKGEGEFLDIGTPESYAAAERFISP